MVVCDLVRITRLAAGAADLLLVHLESVAVLHFERVRGVSRLHTLTLEEETDRRHVLALALAKGVHELLKLGTALDLEEDLVVIICHLNIEVLSTSGISVRTLASRASIVVVVGHDEWFEKWCLLEARLFVNVGVIRVTQSVDVRDGYLLIYARRDLERRNEASLVVGRQK